MSEISQARGTVDPSQDANTAGASQQPPTLPADPSPGKVNTAPHFTSGGGGRGHETKNNG